MNSVAEEPIFFKTGHEFRTWLTRHHLKQSEQWVGFHKKHTGKPSISWPEAVDEALCFGWIDGKRKTIDGQSYKIRFTPRRTGSVWSAVNIRRMQELIRQHRVQPPGRDAFAKKVASKSGIYAYENRRSAVLTPGAEKKFRSHPSAWEWFQKQAPSYRQIAIWWVVSAKRVETQEKRLTTLIANSDAKQKIGPLTTAPSR